MSGSNVETTPKVNRPAYSEIEGASGWPGRLTSGAGCVATQPLVDLLSSARQGCSAYIVAVRRG
jgi:hypothetical protein